MAQLRLQLTAILKPAKADIERHPILKPNIESCKIAVKVILLCRSASLLQLQRKSKYLQHIMDI